METEQAMVGDLREKREPVEKWKSERRRAVGRTEVLVGTVGLTRFKNVSKARPRLPGGWRPVRGTGQRPLLPCILPTLSRTSNEAIHTRKSTRKRSLSSR